MAELLSMKHQKALEWTGVPFRERFILLQVDSTVGYVVAVI